MAISKRFMWQETKGVRDKINVNDPKRLARLACALVSLKKTVQVMSIQCAFIPLLNRECHLEGTQQIQLMLHAASFVHHCTTAKL